MGLARGADGEVLVRGAMISPATWSAGALHPRAQEWLATGDLARADPTGELRFIGRKSETIVTASGVNIHPEDIEAAFEQEPEVIGCAVVPVATALGTEACAVLALRGLPGPAAIAQRANTRLADFQRIRRWVVWDEPDLPRTSTGKVRRALVAAWVREREAVKLDPASPATVSGNDWLLDLIVGISGARVGTWPRDDHDPRLSEDLRIDSLGRIQLLDSLEQRLGVALNAAEYDRVETLGALRDLVARAGMSETMTTPANPGKEEASIQPESNAAVRSHVEASEVAPLSNRDSERKPLRFVYPQWPWWGVFRLLRAAFVECVLRPLVWFLAAPRVVSTGVIETLNDAEPMLIVANHITSFDVPLLLYGLPRELRDCTAVAMSGEMLEDFRHARGLKPGLLNPLGPAAWVLMTALFNVFPLPRKRDFQRSFAHAGRALDRGFHVVVFPEGTRSIAGELASFRPGIGLLVKQSYAAVLPVALVGLGELKAKGRGWFRSGQIEVRVGAPIRFVSIESEAAITGRLHSEVEGLLNRN